MSLIDCGADPNVECEDSDEGFNLLKGKVYSATCGVGQPTEGWKLGGDYWRVGPMWIPMGTSNFIIQYGNHFDHAFQNQTPLCWCTAKYNVMQGPLSPLQVLLYKLNVTDYLVHFIQSDLVSMCPSYTVHGPGRARSGQFLLALGLALEGWSTSS